MTYRGNDNTSKPLIEIISEQGFDGLEYAPLPEQDAFDALTETYTGHGVNCHR